MANKQIVELECDLCDNTLQVSKDDLTTVGWTSVEMKGLTFNSQGTVDRVKFEVCPTCSAAILKTINERSQ